MSLGFGPLTRGVATIVMVTVASAFSGCTRTPGPTAGASSQRAQSKAPEPEPKEGLTFRYRGAGDGVNTNGSTPSTSWTEFEVSDGSEVRAYQHSFKRPEQAEKFYSDKIARAVAVLQEDGRVDDTAAKGRRAVIKFAARDGEPRGAILKLTGSSVGEVMGPTVGHALAFERWQGAERQQ